MQLLEETKTFRVPLGETLEFASTARMVEAVLSSLHPRGEWFVLKTETDPDTFECDVTVRRTPWAS